MSAWEEDWEFDGRRWLRTKPTADEPYGETLAAFDYSANSIEEAGKLAAAAPSMARFLRTLYAEHGDNRSTFDWAYWAEEIEAELVKAGVPLPEEPTPTGSEGQ